MKPTILQEPLPQVSADVLVVPLFEGAPPPEELDAPLGGMLSQVVGTDFRGEADETLLLYTGGRVASPKLVLVGLGKEERVSPRRLFRTAAVGARAARKGGGRRVALAVPAVAAIPPEQVARFMTEGALHGLYRFPTFKSEEKARPEVESLALVGGPELEPGAERGAIVAEAVNLARELTWLPGNHLTARQLAERAEQLCRESGIDVTVYDREGCRELGLGLLLAVNQGSREEPRFVVMRYRGNGGRGPWLGLVGKGIMFDSGGISIKPNEGMWHMKDDMGGAAAVLGAMQAIARLNPAADVMGVIALTDNMPDGGAYKPGDVIVGLSGKTVEIRSTDAEGRLVLADALAYAASQNCTRLITVATLTGAAQIALGPVRFAMVSNDDAWEAQVWEAAEAAGERGWRLPHDEEYYDLFKSPIADMTNSGKPRTAGTVVGGLFLMKHAGETPCVHLDIAAQVWQEEPDAAADAGATGVGVRTLVETALRWAEVRE